jgi:hypothetical protein
MVPLNSISRGVELRGHASSFAGTGQPQVGDTVELPEADQPPLFSPIERTLELLLNPTPSLVIAGRVRGRHGTRRDTDVLLLAAGYGTPPSPFEIPMRRSHHE